MKAKAPALLVLFLSTMILSCVAHGPTQKVESVKIAILPEYSLNLMAARYAPLIDRLQKSLGSGYRVEWISCPSPEAFMATVEREQPDLSIQDAFHTGLLAKLQDARPFLQMEGPGGERSRHGVIAVAEGSDIADLAALKGRTVAVASKRSYLGFIAPVLLLDEKTGVRARDLEIVTVRWQDEVIARLHAGDTDAGFIASESVPPGLKVLASTEPVGSDCLVTLPGTDPEVAARVRESLLSLDPQASADRAVLGALGIGGFRPLDPDTWEEIRSVADMSLLPY